MNADRLVTTISLQDGLLEGLRATNVLNGYHVSHIKSFADELRSNIKLLEIIKRRGRVQFRSFRECLCRTNQRHVIPLLKPGAAGGRRGVQYNAQILYSQLSIVLRIELWHTNEIRFCIMQLPVHSLSLGN